MTSESYRLVENSFQFYTLIIHICLHTYPPFTNSHHSNPHSPPFMFYLFIHITLKKLMDPFSISSLSNWYPFIISYSCIPFFIVITPIHFAGSSPYRFHSNITCSSNNSHHPPLTISLTLAPAPSISKTHYLDIF